MTELGTLPGKRFAVASGLNNRGQVVGKSFIRRGSDGEEIGSHAFLWDKGRMIDLGTLAGTTESAATAINEHGQIVGSSGDHAVLWTLKRG